MKEPCHKSLINKDLRSRDYRGSACRNLEKYHKIPLFFALLRKWSKQQPSPSTLAALWMSHTGEPGSACAGLSCNPFLTVSLPSADVDECEVLNGGCQQGCVNTHGSFQCQCRAGYRLHADGRTCIGKGPLLILPRLVLLSLCLSAELPRLLQSELWLNIITRSGSGSLWKCRYCQTFYFCYGFFFWWCLMFVKVFLQQALKNLGGLHFKWQHFLNSECFFFVAYLPACSSTVLGFGDFRGCFQAKWLWFTGWSYPVYAHVSGSTMELSCDTLPVRVERMNSSAVRSKPCVS